MYPQLTFASVCKKYMKNDGKVLSFKAMLYKTAMWAGQPMGMNVEANQHLSWSSGDCFSVCIMEAKNR